MTSPTSLAVTPASPVKDDGILFIVTGPVGSYTVDETTKVAAKSTAKIVIKDSTSRVRAASPVFSQSQRKAVRDTKVSITGTGTGGYFTLSAVVRQPYAPGNPETAADYGYDVDLGTTAHIVYDASDDDVNAAIMAAWGTGVSVLPGGVGVASVSGGPLGTHPIVIDFGNGPFALRDVEVTVNDHATGGTTVLTETVQGGVLGTVDPTYSYGPIQLPNVPFAGGATHEDYTADVIYVDVPEADSTGVNPGDSLLDSPTSFTVSAS